ncbi:hypothetical protein ACRAWD_21810 [Caulobacter segnis]
MAGYKAMAGNAVPLSLFEQQIVHAHRARRRPRPGRLGGRSEESPSSRAHLGRPARPPPPCRRASCAPSWHCPGRTDRHPLQKASEPPTKPAFPELSSTAGS